MSDYNNKVVWITGASSGIGEALVMEFARLGAKVVLSSRREDELKRVREKCKLPEEKVMVLPLDVANHGEAASAAEKVLSRFGAIDVLVNNAGLSHWSKINDMTFEVLQRIMNVNFFGAVALTKAVLPHFVEKKRGQIIVVSSILGKIVTPKQAAYNASKHALHGFFDTLRAEYGSAGVRVLLVCPGFVNTNVAVNSLDRDGKPIGRNNKLIESGLSPSYVASQIAKAAASGKEEILLAGGKEKFGVLLKRFAPALYSKFIANSKLV